MTDSTEVGYFLGLAHIEFLEPSWKDQSRFWCLGDSNGRIGCCAGSDDALSSTPHYQKFANQYQEKDISSGDILAWVLVRLLLKNIVFYIDTVRSCVATSAVRLYYSVLIIHVTDSPTMLIEEPDRATCTCQARIFLDTILTTHRHRECQYTLGSHRSLLLDYCRLPPNACSSRTRYEAI